MAKSDEAEHRMLRIRSPGHPARLEDLIRDRYAIGRGEPKQPSSVDFRIADDDAVSRVHVVVQRDGDGYAVENKSANGTLLNGKVVEEPRQLAHRDTISIGENTTLEFLVLSAAERTREFDLLTAGTEKKEQSEAVEKKTLFQRPIVWAMLGFYGILAILLVGAIGRQKSRAKDPGPGPYFTWVRERPLEAPPELKSGQREIAERMWESDLRQHGGPFAGKGGHDYRLLVEARDLSVLGYTSVDDALTSEEVVAQTLVRVQGELEDRVSGYYKEVKQSRKSGRTERALDYCVKIIEAVPSRDAAIRRYAEALAKRLRR